MSVSICQIASINGAFLPMLKEASSSERPDLLATYRLALDCTKKELEIAALFAIINNSSMSDSTKSALIRSLQRSTAGKVAFGVGYAVAGPVGAAIGAAGGLAVGVGVALSKL
ncbi:MAG: hypothetical protein LBI34_02880 [Puniceicoccales bacterium]|jgi:hypothetical protein|nr:hypothetical protein [Puniceicoccales bacterium]